MQLDDKPLGIDKGTPVAKDRCARKVIGYGWFHCARSSTRNLMYPPGLQGVNLVGSVANIQPTYLGELCFLLLRV